jgi:alpha-L-rhamnosidase
MATYGKLLGFDADAAKYRALADDILRTFIRNYWDTTAHAFRKGTVNNLESQNAMGLAYGMVPGGDLSAADPRYVEGEQSQAANKRSVAATIANDIVSRGNHFGAGLMGLRYIYDILNDYGYKDLAFQMVTQTTNPSWGDLIARGNTALTESWGAATGDHHYMSQVLTWYYQDAGGIRPSSPGYRTVTVRPYVPTVPGTSEVPTSVNQTGLASSLLDDVDVSVRTTRGTVSSKWFRRDDGRIAMIVKVPANTPTEIWVPTMDKPVDALPSARFVRNDLVGTEPFAVYAVDGGDTYLFNLSTSAGGTVGGTVPATLSLTLGAPASFGAFTPGVAKDYTASTAATVTSSAGDASLTVAPSPAYLTNGTFSLPSPLEVSFSRASWTGPVSNDPVTVGFKQHIGAGDALRTGAYSKTLTFTLSTTQP